MSRRFQFSLRTLFWLMLCVACFFFGIEWRRRNWEHAVNTLRRSLETERHTVRLQSDAYERLKADFDELKKAESGREPEND